MNQILRDTSVGALTRAIEENPLGFVPAFRRWPRTELHDEEGITWSIADIPYPLFNVVLRTRLSAARAESAIERIVNEAQKRHVPILWEVWPSSEPRDLKERLEQHGFAAAGRPPGMALDLDKLREDLPSVPGLTIRRVGSAEDWERFLEIWRVVYEVPGFVARAMGELFRHAPEGTLFSYVGWQEGQPVAISQMLLHAGVAGIYSVATIPEARRKGIGTQITLAALHDARAMGYRVSILHSSKMGLGVYRRLGFREYCTLARYLWTPKETKDEEA